MVHMQQTRFTISVAACRTITFDTPVTTFDTADLADLDETGHALSHQYLKLL